MRTLPLPDPGTPPLRSPWRYLVWTATRQKAPMALAALYGTVWMLALALEPYTISRAIDDGMIGHDRGALITWSGVFLALAVICALAGMMRHRYAVENWLRACFEVVQLVGRHATSAGAALPRAMPAGKVVATVASDAERVARPFDVFGRFCASLVAYAAVAVLLLASSLPLGLVVLLGVPVLLASLGLIMRPLRRRQDAQREESGRLTELGADTVAGLRVLRGIGGEAVFARRYVRQSQLVRERGIQVSGTQATLDAAQVLLPGVFIVVVTWLGARSVFDGSLAPGQLVAFFGYTTFLVMPLRTATEMAEALTHALVAADRVIAVLRVRGDHTGQAAASALPAGPQPLVDAASGVEIHPGMLTAVVSARPQETAALADRLGRFGPDRRGVTLGGVDLMDLPVDRVRSRIVVSHTDPRLFAGTLRDELDPRGRHDDEAILAALEAADARDVLDELPGGLAADVEERGHTFSGGQRQRLALARALLTGAETLVLVEPTSAVDAHTEARIAARLALARAGRTTVVMTESPLLLARADRVLLLVNGRQVAAGRHRQLLAGCPAYRRVVARDEPAAPDDAAYPDPPGGVTGPAPSDTDDTNDTEDTEDTDELEVIPR